MFYKSKQFLSIKILFSTEIYILYIISKHEIEIINMIQYLN